ncbi:hypothetical protein BJY52DRAFT_1417016 [Lactarius psammicola]|nr:hypothetical protein BJY52DRAFT_1417016 [Lactarius psammicola]
MTHDYRVNIGRHHYSLAALDSRTVTASGNVMSRRVGKEEGEPHAQRVRGVLNGDADGVATTHARRKWHAKDFYARLGRLSCPPAGGASYTVARKVTIPKALSERRALMRPSSLGCHHWVVRLGGLRLEEYPAACARSTCNEVASREEYNIYASNGILTTTVVKVRDYWGGYYYLTKSRSACSRQKHRDNYRYHVDRPFRVTLCLDIVWFLSVMGPGAIHAEPHGWHTLNARSEII